MILDCNIDLILKEVKHALEAAKSVEMDFTHNGDEEVLTLVIKGKKYKKEEVI